MRAPTSTSTALTTTTLAPSPRPCPSLNASKPHAEQVTHYCNLRTKVPVTEFPTAFRSHQLCLRKLEITTISS
ncbi:unnamed protein product [Tilletia controversa]|nr:unnamed protein product [Tilletia controversa]